MALPLSLMPLTETFKIKCHFERGGIFLFMRLPEKCHRNHVTLTPFNVHSEFEKSPLFSLLRLVVILKTAVV